MLNYSQILGKNKDLRGREETSTGASAELRPGDRRREGLRTGSGPALGAATGRPGSGGGGGSWPGGGGGVGSSLGVAAATVTSLGPGRQRSRRGRRTHGLGSTT
jgi:hypothetical protein